MTADDADDLRDFLLQAATTHDAQLGSKDDYGQRYMVDFQVVWRGKRATIRSGWILENGSEVPRLTSCFVL
jgi:hypothetical protein